MDKKQFKLSDITSLGYSPDDASQMFDGKKGIALHTAINAVPNQEILDQILNKFEAKLTEVEEQCLPPKKVIEENCESESEISIPSEEDEKTEEYPLKQSFEENNAPEESEPEEEIDECPVPSETASEDKIVFVETDTLKNMEVFSQFSKKLTKSYQVILPNSGATATVKPISLSDLDSINNSTLFSDFEYYKRLLEMIYKAIVTTSLPFSTFEEFASSINIYDIDDLLFGIYKLMYGDDTEFSTNCEHCGEKIELRIPLDKLKITTPEVQLSITNILNGDLKTPSFEKEIILPNLEDVNVGTTLPTLRKQLEINTFLEQQGESTEGLIYKYMLHIAFFAIKVDNKNSYVKFDSYDKIYSFIKMAYTELSELSAMIDTYSERVSAYRGTTLCPNPKCKAENVLFFDLKSDFLHKTLTN